MAGQTHCVRHSSAQNHLVAILALAQRVLTNYDFDFAAWRSALLISYAAPLQKVTSSKLRCRQDRLSQCQARLLSSLV